MRHAGLDDHVGAQPPDELLDADHVLGELDDRAAHPSEPVDVFHVPAAAQPGRRHRLERFGRVQGMLCPHAIGAVQDYPAASIIDGEHRTSCPSATSVARSAERLLNAAPNSTVSRTVSIGGKRTVGAPGAKSTCQPKRRRSTTRDGGVAGVGAGGEVVEPVASAGSDRREQSGHLGEADIVLGGFGRLVKAHRARVAALPQQLAEERVAWHRAAVNVGQPHHAHRLARIGEADGLAGEFGEVVKIGRIGGRAEELRGFIRRGSTAVDAGRGQEQKRSEVQRRQAACGDADMGFRGVLRAGAKIAGQADAVDDVTGVAAGLQQGWQCAAGHPMNPVAATFECGDQGAADVTGGAEHGEVGRRSGAGIALRPVLRIAAAAPTKAWQTCQ